MEEIEEIYQKIIDQTNRDFSKREFGELIEEKMEEMGGLCDEETAAQLIAKDLGLNPKEKYVDVADIDEDMDRVSFKAKIIDTQEVRSFDRNDGSVGRVANMTLADETGEVRVVLWDDDADLVKLGEVKEGDVLKIRRGKVKSGFNGPEVNLSNVSDLSIEEEVDFDVELNERTKIGELEPDMGSVNVFGEVVDVDEVREFENENGDGKVRSVKLGDESGRIRVSLWGDHAEMDLEPGDCLLIEYGYTRERYGEVELNVGYRGKIEKKEEGVSFHRNLTPLSELVQGKRFDVRARVTGKRDTHFFERKDGSEGKVSNIHLSDGTGDRRVALWGDKAEFVEDVEVGDVVLLEDAQARENNGEIELSLDWNSSIEVLDEEREEVCGSIYEIKGGEDVDVVGSVVDENVVDDGLGCVWVRYDGDFPSVGSRVNVIGESLVENNRVVIEAEEIKKVSFEEDEAEEISRNLLEKMEFD